VSTNSLDLLALEQEIHRRLKGPKYVTDGLFKEQSDFLFENSKLKVAFNTRRSGKSYLAAAALFHFGLSAPGTQSVYIALTRDSARRILWPILEKLNSDYQIKAELLESSLEAKLPNGSSFFIVGADQKNFIGRLLGVPYKLAIIDECQNFRDHIKDLIDEVLTPSMMDYNGQIWLLGTPGHIPAGYFYDVTTDKIAGYSKHKWTLFDNPHLPNANEFLDALLERNRWTRDHPTYRRQYLGEWVIDTDALLYKFNELRNVCSEIPTFKTTHRIMGIDFGYDDATAWVIITWHEGSKDLYVEYAFKKSGMIPTEIAETTKNLIDRYSPVKIVADTGGLGKSIAEELRRRHSIPVHAASKTDKATYIQFMNDDFVSGRLKVMANLTNYISEIQMITKGENGLEEPDCLCDLADSALYAHREANHWLQQSQKFISRDSQEYMDEMLEKDANKGKNSRDWWEKLDNDNSGF